MDSTSIKQERLQAIRNSWFNEPLGIEFPDLGYLSRPTSCAELVISDRITSSFSGTDDPIADGLANSARYGVENPGALMIELNKEISSSATGRVDPSTIKKSYFILNELRRDYIALASDLSTSEVAAAHRADEQASLKAIKIIAALAQELGISLPVHRGNNTGGRS